MADKKVFTTYDEEYGYYDRISNEIRDWLERKDLDTVNNEFVITVEINKV